MNHEDRNGGAFSISTMIYCNESGKLRQGKPNTTYFRILYAVCNTTSVSIEHNLVITLRENWINV